MYQARRLVKSDLSTLAAFVSPSASMPPNALSDEDAGNVILVSLAKTWQKLNFTLQMCSPRVTPFVPGQSVTVGKRHYSHAYLL